MKRRTLLLLCLAIVIAAPFAVSRLTAFRAVSERHLAREAGIPLTAAEFPMPRVAAADDAAPDYMALAGLLKRRPVTNAEITVLRSFGGNKPRPDAKTLADIRRILRAHKDALALIHRAAGKPSAAFPLNFDTLMIRGEEPVPLDAFKAASYLIRAEAASLAMDGRWDEAVRTQALEFRMASHAASTPAIVAFLIGAALDKTAIAGMTDLLRWARPSERVSRSIVRAIEGNRPHYDVPRALKGEYLAMSGALRAMRLEAAQKRDEEVPLRLRTRLPEVLKSEHDPRPKAMFSYWDSDYLHYLRPIIAAAELPLPQRQPAVLRAKEQIPSSALHLMSSTMLPALCDAPAREIQVEAQRAVALGAAQALMLTAQTGRCPDAGPGGSLLAAGQLYRLPTDPWWGRPIDYGREPDGFVVYSEGERGTFDGRSRPGTGGEAFFRWKRGRN